MRGMNKKILPDLIVSVPTYNRSRLLDNFLEAHAALFARYDIPLYIYDNASTDDTEHVVRKWIEVYPLISYFRQPENLGPCLLYTSPSPRDGATSRMPSSA